MFCAEQIRARMKKERLSLKRITQFRDAND